MNLSARDLNGHCGQASVDVSVQLGRGATATVHTASLNGQRYAAKIFHEDCSFPTAKVVAMLANPPRGLSDKSGDPDGGRLAWPTAILSDDKGQDVGFLMPELDLKVAFPLDYFYDQTLFKKLNSPNEAALSFKLEIARNLSRLVADLHDQGHCFIDMKPQNIRVNLGSHEVCLLDCDGFSIAVSKANVQIACQACGEKNRVPTARLGESPSCGKCGRALLPKAAGTASNTNVGTRFPAELLSTDYISPEAFRGNILPSALGEPQDRYALAVLLFQLLNRGTHPFQGIPLDDSVEATTNDEKAARGLYPHGLQPHPSLSPRRHSIHEHFDRGLRHLFDQAFIGNSSNRPSARDWANKLELMLNSKSIVRCDKFPSDVSHMRFKDQKCPACYLASVPSVSVSKTKILKDHSSSVPYALQTPTPQPNKSAHGSWALPGGIAILIVLMVVLLNGSNKVTTEPQAVEQHSTRTDSPAIAAKESCNLILTNKSNAELCRIFWGSSDKQPCDGNIADELNKREVEVKAEVCGNKIRRSITMLQLLGESNRSIQKVGATNASDRMVFFEATTEVEKAINSAVTSDSQTDETRLFKGVVIKPFSSLVLAYGAEDCSALEEVSGVCTQVQRGLICGFDAIRGKAGKRVCLSSFVR